MEVDKILEWFAVGITVIAVILNSFALAPWSNISGILSGLIWTVIAIKWNKRSLLVMQLFFALVYFVGFIDWLF